MLPQSQSSSLLHGGDIVSYNLQGHDGTSSHSGVIVPQMGLPGNPAKQEGSILSVSAPNRFLVILIILVITMTRNNRHASASRSNGLFFVYAAQFLRLCSEVIGLPLPLKPGGTSFNTQNPIPHKSQKTKGFLETSRAKEF